MEVVQEPSAFGWRQRGSAVTIGAFDGVHLGHRAVIAQVQERAAAADLATVVVTFDRHPASVVRPESAPLLLTDLQQKLELLASTGVDATVVLRFDEARSLEPAREFVTEVLVEGLGARVVVVGEDFHFGHRRQGDVALLKRMGAEHGFDVVGVRLRPVEGSGLETHVSSTAIRRALVAGDVGLAARLLGRPHEVRGVVLAGDRRGGKELGYPTANVAVAGDVCLPAEGIYAGWYARADEVGQRPAAISLGRRPTFYDAADKPLLEAHLLDFDGDLYGEGARVRFVARLRDERRFDSVEALVIQMRRDVEQTRATLGV